MQHYQLPNIVTGDHTRKKISFRITVDGAPLDLTGCSIKMQFRPYNDGSYLAKTLETPTAKGLTITDALDGRFDLERYKADMPPNRYISQVQVTDTEGKVTTYFNCEQKVKSDLTQ
jgi:hypothetical protein